VCVGACVCVCVCVCVYVLTHNQNCQWSHTKKQSFANNTYLLRTPLCFSLIVQSVCRTDALSLRSTSQETRCAGIRSPTENSVQHAITHVKVFVGLFVHLCVCLFVCMCSLPCLLFLGCLCTHVFSTFALVCLSGIQELRQVMRSWVHIVQLCLDMLTV